MKKLVSVIIPVYNRESMLKDCVSSVLSQTYQNLEVILIDDGSTDQSAAICREMAYGDSRIKVLEAEHGGVSAARNKGLEYARGEYIFFVDSDDMIHPQVIEALADGMDSSGAPIAGSDVIGVSEKNWAQVAQRISQDIGPGEITVHNHQDTLEAFFRSSTPINLIGGVMMRRDWIGQTRFRTDLHIGEDFFFIYENLIKGAQCVFLKQKWYYARHHRHNSSWDFGYSGFWTRFSRRKLVWENEDALGRSEYASRQKREALGICLHFLTRNGGRSDAGRKIRQTMKQHREPLFDEQSLRSKLLYCLGVYLPDVYALIFRMKRMLRKAGR